LHHRILINYPNTSLRLWTNTTNLEVSSITCKYTYSGNYKDLKIDSRKNGVENNLL